MRRKSVDIQPKNIEGVRLYLDDIEFCHEQLSKLGDVTIESGEWEFDSVDELRKLPELAKLSHDSTRVLELKVSTDGWRRSATVSVSKSSVYIRCRVEDEDAELQARGLLDTLVEHVKSRRTFLSKALGYPTIALLLIVAVALVVFGLSSGRDNVGFAGLVLFPVAMLTNLIVGYRSTERAAVVILRYRRDAPSFWKRNRDQLLVGLIVGVIVAAITVPLTWALTSNG
jgi:hypothetical protein